MINWLLLCPLALLAYTTLVAAAGFVVQAADRGEHVTVSGREASVLARESVARALFVLLRPLAFGQPGPHLEAPTGSPQARPPVLLVGGLHTHRASWSFLRTFLVKRGWPCVWPVHVGRDATLAQRAARLAERVEELKRHTGATQIDVVAFSSGGLVAAWYLRHLDGAASVRRLITLGTPWQGTRMAVFARHDGARELSFGSHVLDSIRPPPVPTLCVWSPDDPVVVPAESGALVGVQSVRLEAAGHLEMLLSARVYRAVQQGLTHPLTEPVS